MSIQKVRDPEFARERIQEKEDEGLDKVVWYEIEKWFPEEDEDNEGMVNDGILRPGDIVEVDGHDLNGFNIDTLKEETITELNHEEAEVVSFQGGTAVLKYTFYEDNPYYNVVKEYEKQINEAIKKDVERHNRMAEGDEEDD